MNDNNYPNFNKDEARNIPLKYTGYRVFSKWTATDQNFFIVRRFGALGARVALSLQDEVSQLEQKLEDLDQDASRRDEDGDINTFINNGSFRDDRLDKRKAMVKKEIPKALSKYYTFINQYSQLVSRPRAEPDAIQNIRRWFDNHRTVFEDEVGSSMTAIDDVEAAYICEEKWTEDLIPVQPKNKSPFRRFLEKSLLLKIRGIRKPFERKPLGWERVDPMDTGKDRDGTTIWENDKVIDQTAGILAAICCLIMLIGPLWVLEHVTGIDKRLGVITGFIVGFFILVSLATTAKMSDAVGAAAAYAAVLVVFLTLGAGSG